jgi:N-acetylmuramoyl-L-alanine amidase
VHDQQRRLAAAGFLAPGSAEDSTFCARTHQAVLAFQDSYGLAVTGECDEQTWSALIEASWSLGERLLFLRSPNIRGDDVAELQTHLNRLGFDCGRVDGIFGPRTVRAINDFQTNVGLTPNGICTPEFVDVLKRMGAQSGEGPGVAVVRESVSLSDADAHNSARIAVGYLAGGAHVAHALTRRARETHPLTSTVEGDAVAQAQAANRFSADVYLCFEGSPDNGCTIYFYEVPTYVSVGGRNLAARIAAAIADRVPELSVSTQGVRHPVLRETRMTAVLCSLGPQSVVSLTRSQIAAAVNDALDAWRADPLHEIA